ncbi:MAG: polysaccharide biosynthesis C-terminal domain-containing protein [Candidatus Hodarchaeota archaeon]
MSEYREFAKNIGTTAIGQMLVYLGGILLLLMLTKTLGAGDYGLWVQVEVTVSLLTIISGLGLPYALNRFLVSERDPNKVRDIFYSTVSFTLASTILLSIFLFIFSSSFANLFFDGNQEVVLIAAIIAPIRALWWSYLNYFRAFREMDRYTLITVSQRYGVIVLSSLFIFVGYGLIGVVSTLIISYTATLLILAYLVIRRIGLEKPAFVGLGKRLRFSLPAVPGALSFWVVDVSDRYVIGALLGAVFLGYYSSAYVIGSISIFASSILGLILISTLSKLYDEGKMTELKNHMTYSLKLFLMVSIPLIFGNMALSKPILTVLSTAEIANYGYMVATVTSIGTVFFGVQSIFAQILVVVKKTEIVASIWGISALVNLALALSLVVFLGVIGAAIATLTSYLIACFLTTYFSSKILTFEIDLKFIAKCILSSLVMYGVISLFSPIGAVQTFLVILFGVGIYFFMLIVFRGFKKGEINFVKNLVKSLGR